MDYIVIPDTDIKLFQNSIVILERIPNTKWILKKGRYMVLTEMQDGWYFLKIASMEIIPLDEADLVNIIIVSIPCQPVPEELPNPETPEYTQSLEKYVPDTVYYKDQLLYINEGILYQTTTRFNSSSFKEDEYSNLEIDLELGNIVEVLPEDFPLIFEALEQIDEEISSIESNISIITSDIGDIQLELDTKQDKSIYLSDTVISNFTPSTTYPDYPYQGAYQDSRFTDDTIPHVYFSGTDVLSGNYAPIALSENETLYIYSKVDHTVTIPIIILERTQGD